MFGKSPRPPEKEEGVCLDEPLVVTEVWKVDSKMQFASGSRTLTIRKTKYMSDGEISWRVDKETFDAIDVGDRIEVQFRPVNPIEG